MVLWNKDWSRTDGASQRNESHVTAGVTKFAKSGDAGDAPIVYSNMQSQFAIFSPIHLPPVQS